MKKRILIIEDEREISLILKMRLENAGYEVQQAFDGDEGLDRAKNERPDVILLDIILPRRTGIQILEELKSDPDFKMIPIILITGLAREFDDYREGDIKADGYFLKPFDSSELLATISGFFGISSDSSGSASA
jgi:DNA-binding response OmpR family regulator